MTGRATTTHGIEFGFPLLCLHVLSYIQRRNLVRGFIFQARRHPVRIERQ